MAFIYKSALNLQGPDDHVQSALLFIQSYDYGLGSIDFEAITPMPAWVYTGMDETVKEKYGADFCEQGWRRIHWGVSENALGLAKSAAGYDGGSTVEFDTLGGDIRGLVRKLSMIFPALYVDYLWASEDVGRDSGMAQYHNGELSMEYIPPPTSTKAYELCFDLSAKTAKDYGLAYDPASATYQYDGALIQQKRKDVQDEIKKDD